MTRNHDRLSRCFALATLLALGAGCGSSEGDNPLPDGGVCGTSGGATCLTSEFCDFANDTCGAGNRAGTCTRRPEVCLPVVQPVCGCNAVFYNNDCAAQSAGTDVDSTRTPNVDCFP